MKEVQKIKERWLKEECDDIDDLQEKRQYDMLYRKMKDLHWMYGRMPVKREINQKALQIEIEKDIEDGDKGLPI